MESEGFGADVGAVVEDDYGEAVVREADDVGAEPLGFAVVPHAGVGAVGI